jgi:arylsulfatase A-like enzyme
MNRRFIARWSRIICCAIALGAGRLSVAAADRPINLLFLMMDQVQFQAMGCAGNPAVKTPNLDRLAAGGTRFVNSFCVVPYCSPTRAALVTGLYPSTLGIGRNILIGPNAGRDPLRLHEPIETYMHHLTAQGYHCHQLGKWHLGVPAQLSCFPDGKEDDQLPNELFTKRKKEAGATAFDDGPRPGEVERVVSKALVAGDAWMRQPVADAYHIVQKSAENETQGVFGRSNLKPKYWVETALTDYCIDLIKRHKEKDEPFAITWSVSPPHAPFIAPSPFYDMYNPSSFVLPPTWSDHPAEFAKNGAARMGGLYGEAGFREYLRCYYARITMMDDLVGRLLNTLDELGLADHTLVIFTSDHGNMIGEHGMIEKSTEAFYDDLMRVPLLMRLPGKIAAGKTSDAVADSVDIAPTLLDYLGQRPLLGAQGRSLRPLLEGKVEEDHPVFGERGEVHKPNLGRVIRTSHWKLAIHPNEPRGNKEQLYDLQNDPGETKNLSADPTMKPILGELTGRLLDHMDHIGDPALTEFKK